MRRGVFVGRDNLTAERQRQILAYLNTVVAEKAHLYRFVLPNGSERQVVKIFRHGIGISVKIQAFSVAPSLEFVPHSRLRLRKGYSAVPVKAASRRRRHPLRRIRKSDRVALVYVVGIQRCIRVYRSCKVMPCRGRKGVGIVPAFYVYSVRALNLWLRRRTVGPDRFRKLFVCGHRIRHRVMRFSISCPQLRILCHGHRKIKPLSTVFLRVPSDDFFVFS